jgi:acyl-CoA dehydrogenase family member 9
MADLKSMKGVSEKDRKLIAEAEDLLGPEPESMGFVKNLFWGRFREDLVLPYPEVGAEETARATSSSPSSRSISHEHPAIQIDQEQEIPRWVIDRLFKMGVLGMTIPKEYGGRGWASPATTACWR